ncbi:YSIRK-type signal peptide-containing protein, partial [Streptococcus hyovaginalis]|uniref:YSIRK-type signal peptide-containing protein n=1 Tax=Streptococcus hyovaginalis TaxID=149015 RepID=UPI002A90EB63
MNRKRLRLVKKSPMFEKKVIFGIRKFTIGVASVGIATAFLMSGPGQTVHAEEVATPVEAIITDVSEQPVETVKPAPVAETTPTALDTAPSSEETVTESTSNSTGVSETVETPVVTEVVETVDNASAEPLATTETAVAERAAAETATLSTPAEAPIEEGSIRLHFENVDETAPENQGLWTWGGVAEPSDGNQWPTDTANFSSSQVDDYGHYVDIKKSE